MSARLCGHGYDLNKQSCLFCEIDTWKSRAVTAETALAAAQAQVKELREALREFYPCGRISHDRLVCERHVGHSGFHASTDGAQVNWPDAEAVGDSPLPAALAAPSDTTALRALLLKAANLTASQSGRGVWHVGEVEAIVDAVLAKEGM